MLEELKARLAAELERVSQELAARVPPDLPSSVVRADDPACVELDRLLRRRIRFLGRLASGLSCVDPATIHADRAGYGSVVRVRDLTTGAEATYTLMSGDFIDLDDDQVSLASPLGHEILGRRAGERIVVATPRGERRYEILFVLTLPERLGLPGPDPGARETVRPRTVDPA